MFVKYLTLSEAAKLFPARRANKKTHRNTLHRWSVSGCKGIILKTYSVGATRCTTEQDVQNFVEALTRQRDGEEGGSDASGAPQSPVPSPGGRSPARRSAGHSAAMRKLEADGLTK